MVHHKESYELMGILLFKNPSLPSPLGYLKIINDKFGTLFSRLSE